MIDRAELACVENLLNCYCREVAGPAGDVRFGRSHGGSSVRVALSATGRVLEAPARQRSLTGAVELLGPIVESGSEPGRELSWREVAEALVAEVGARQHAEPHPELLSLVADSLAVSRTIRARPAPAAGALDFIASEQALASGHPFHPSPKSRLGFASAELARYSPELGARFRLRYFAARSELVVQRSLVAGASATELVRRQTPEAVVPAGFELIPLHPWQANHVLGLEPVRQALASGKLVDLGELGPEYFATSSVRTLYAPGAPYFLKTSLSMRITNCLRRNALHEMESGLAIAEWMREDGAGLAARFPRFRALDEPAYLSLDLDGDERVSECFGVVLREAAPLEAPGPVTPLLAASLFGDGAEGRSRLARLAGSTAADREAWFARYLELTVPPLLHLFFERGLMFEPHLQNVLVGVDSGTGRVERVFLRDFDNGKVVRGWFSPERLVRLRGRVRDELAYDAESAWRRLVYCLVVNNLAEAAAALADGDLLFEELLWERICSQLETAADTLANPGARALVEALVLSPSLPAKGNFLTRVFKRPDRKAAYFPVANPMSRGVGGRLRRVL